MELMARLVKKWIVICIIGEILTTALGFCGHTHAHPAPGDINQAIHTHFHIHPVTHPHHDKETDHHHDGCAEAKCRMHCSCLGGFLGICEAICFHITLSSQSYIIKEQEIYTFFFFPIIDHPPLFIN